MLEIEANTYDGSPLTQKLSAQFDQKGGTVGRSDDNRLILPDPQKHVSRVHVEIVYTDEGYYLVRLGANAVYVNQVEVSQGARRLLHDSDAITIGAYALTARIQDAPSPLLTTPKPIAVAPPPTDPSAADPSADDPMGLDELFGPAGAKLPGRPGAGHRDLGITESVAPVDVPTFAPEPTPFDWTSPSGQTGPVPGTPAAIPLAAKRQVTPPGGGKVAPGSSIDDIWGDLTDEPDVDPLHDDVISTASAGGAQAAGLKTAQAAKSPGVDDVFLPEFSSNPFDSDESATPAAIVADDAGIDWGVTSQATLSEPVPTPVPPAAPEFLDPPEPLASGLAPVDSPGTAATQAPQAASAPAGLDLDDLLGPLAAEPAPKPAPTPEPEARVVSTTSVRHDAPPASIVEMDEPTPAPVAPVQASIRHAPAGADGAADPGGHLIQALARGLGLAPRQLPAEFSPEFAQLLGTLLRESIGGTLELVNARASARKEIRADVTMLSTRRPNNPMKYAPTPEVALARLLNPQESGFMPGVAALHEVFHDIRAHHMAFMAGLQATLTSVLNRLHPEKVEQALGEPKAVDTMLPQGRRAKAWLAYIEQYQTVASEMGNEFNTRLGKEFLQAYEAQVARAKAQGLDAQQGPPA